MHSRGADQEKRTSRIIRATWEATRGALSTRTLRPRANSVEERDRAVGKMTSGDFTIERNFITFWIGGGRARSGSHLGLTLIVDGKPAQTASGKDENTMTLEHFDVQALAGKTARLEIVDDATGGLGQHGSGTDCFQRPAGHHGADGGIGGLWDDGAGVAGRGGGAGERRPNRSVRRKTFRHAGAGSWRWRRVKRRR